MNTPLKQQVSPVNDMQHVAGSAPASGVCGSSPTQVTGRSRAHFAEWGLLYRPVTTFGWLFTMLVLEFCVFDFAQADSRLHIALVLLSWYLLAKRTSRRVVNVLREAHGLPSEHEGVET